MSTINDNKVKSLRLTIVDFDIPHCVGSWHCVAHLSRVVVASCKKVLALYLLAMVAKSVSLGG